MCVLKVTFTTFSGMTSNTNTLFKQLQLRAYTVASMNIATITIIDKMHTLSVIQGQLV